MEVNLLNKYFTYVIVVLFLFSSPFAAKSQKINWMTWEEAEEASLKEKKKFLVDIYTDWCKVCKTMEKTTLSDPEVVEYINTHFYPIKFNAEKKKYITYLGKEYSYGDRGFRGYHQLAVILTQGNLRFPSIVFLDDDFSVIQPIPGFQDKKTFSLILAYFSKDHYQRTPWKTYVTRQDDAVSILK